ncbi:MAG: SurA N-terminal domain-containing protein [Spirochaetes bacterium]|nr:SurA N-terminal domain-containing protein [Spirochaetota bacterium]
MAKMKFTGGRILTLLLMIGLVGVFILWLVQDVATSRMGGSATPQVGKVDGEPIFWNAEGDFRSEYESLIKRYRSQGVEMSDDIEGILKTQALNQVAIKLLLMKRAERYGIEVDESDILNYIKQRYFTENGRYNEMSYRAFQQRGAAADKMRLEREARQTLTIEFLTSLTLFQYLPASSAEVFDRWQAERIRKKARVAVMTFDQGLEKFATEAEVKGWFERNRTNFPGKTYEMVPNEIRERYLVQNEPILRSRMKSQAMQALNQKLASGAFAQGFDAAAASLGMKVQNTDFFTLFAQVLEDERGKVIAEVSSTEFIQTLMMSERGKINGPIDLQTALAVAVVTEVDNAPFSAGDFQTSIATRRKVEERLRREKIQSGLYAFQSQVFKSGKVQSFLKNDVARR